MDPDKIPVWIIDDNKNFCLVLTANLNKTETIECRKCYQSCKAAMRDLASVDSPPTVILMDVRMPDMNGLDAIIPIKEISPATSIIMLTSVDCDDDIQTALTRGASGYLLKYSSSATIVGEIETVLQRSAPL
jgi:DNA-binding NarL/FixJ family response regulator